MNENTKIYSLIVKNQLLGVDINKLKEMYKQDKHYVNFLSSLKMILDEEPEFFWLDPKIILKSYEILNISNNNKKYLEEVNDLKINLNIINNIKIEEKKNRLISYLEKQLKVRKINYNIDVETLKNIISYDCIVYKFIDKNIDMGIPTDFFCSSINYFSEYMPEIFDDTKKINNINMLMTSTLEVLENNNLKGNNRNFKKEYKKKILKTKSKVEKAVKRNQKLKIKKYK